MVLSNFRMMVARFTPKGELDTDFGISAGKTIVNLPADKDERATALAIGRDGKIVLVSVSSDTNNQTRSALWRGLPDGKPDPSFGSNGKKLLDVSGRTKREAHFRSGLVVDDDGKIVMAGTVAIVNGTSKFRLMRVDEKGELDTTFGEGGQVFIDIGEGPDAWAHALAFDTNGKLVVAGTDTVNGNHSFALARFHPDGQLDTTFGFEGKTLVNGTLGGHDDWKGLALAIDRDDRLVVAGVASPRDGEEGGWRYALARCLPDEKPDKSLSKYPTVPVLPAGVVIDYPDATNEIGYDLAVDAKSRIVIAGAATVNGSRRAVLLRRLPDGKPDPDFGTAGTGRTLVSFPESAEEAAMSVKILPNGKIVTAGYALITGYYRVALARHDADGLPDSTFGTDGTGRVLVELPQTNHEAALDLAIDSKGNLVVSGLVADGGPMQPQALQQPSTAGLPLGLADLFLPATPALQ